MSRNRPGGVKLELSQPSTSSRKKEDHDLAYYLHDRVALMREVFTVLKPKEIKSVAPENVRNLSIDNLEELCLDELLGISSKRLCAVLDGAPPPSDTESSSDWEGSDEEVRASEVISLDSVSSDDIVSLKSSEREKKKKHKHKKKKDREKIKKRRKTSNGSKNSDQPSTSTNKEDTSNAKEDQERAKKRDKTLPNELDRVSGDTNKQSRVAKRTGYTVLELLELQARARAIRAQLSVDNSKKDKPQPSQNETQTLSDDEVQIKEEEAEIVEILSSDDDSASKLKEEKMDPELEPQPNTSRVTHLTTTPTTSKTHQQQTKKDDDVTVIENVKRHSNDFTVIIPQNDKTIPRKIKLNRNNVSVSVGKVTNVKHNISIVTSTEENGKRNVTINDSSPDKTIKLSSTVTKIVKEQTVSKKDGNAKRIKEAEDKKAKKIKKRIDKEKSPERDHDEITLELSDSEKMDLLEDLDRKNLEKVSSGSDIETSDSESDSATSEDDNNCCHSDVDEVTDVRNEANALDNDEEVSANDNGNEVSECQNEVDSNNSNEQVSLADGNEVKASKVNETNVPTVATSILDNSDNDATKSVGKDADKNTKIAIAVVKPFDENQDIVESNFETIEISSIGDIPLQVDDRGLEVSEVVNEGIDGNTDVQEIASVSDSESNKREDNIDKGNATKDSDSVAPIDTEVSINKEIIAEDLQNAEVSTHTEKADHIDEHSPNSNNNVRDDAVNSLFIEENVTKIAKNDETTKNVSEGEVTDDSISEVEAHDVQPETICISDDDTEPVAAKTKKKEKKHKNKKSKKSKKKDFQKEADENFYRQETSKEVILADIVKAKTEGSLDIDSPMNTDLDDVYEILEISDDSSCYEIEGTVLSKEPTAEEIEALSAKIDEIKREDVITEEEILQHELEIESKNLENISWKDRYLDSSKVKKVLTTSNILNALRKKNKELKRKMQEVKVVEVEELTDRNEEVNTENLNIEEGSIEHYNTLQGSNKYVDPIKETVNTNEVNEQEINEEKPTETNVTREMKKDAKQLLKMYKRLLKYNDMSAKKDPEKRKKKKKKRSKEDNSSSATELK